MECVRRIRSAAGESGEGGDRHLRQIIFSQLNLLASYRALLAMLSRGVEGEGRELGADEPLSAMAR